MAAMFCLPDGQGKNKTNTVSRLVYMYVYMSVYWHRGNECWCNYNIISYVTLHDL